MAYLPSLLETQTILHSKKLVIIVFMFNHHTGYMKFSCLFILFVFLSSLLQAQDFKQSEIPVWVEKVEVPAESEFSKYDVSSGFYFALQDYQVNLDGHEVFERTVLNVLSYSGITNASQLSITFDTIYQKLKIHHLYIWRNGEKLDRTDQLSFEIMNNQYYLNQGIYSGNITAYDNLEDVRKGDLIEFAYTLVGANPIFENEKYFLLPLESLSHIDILNYRFVFPQERDYKLEFSDSDSLEYTDTILNGRREIKITLASLTPIELEENIPSWEIPFKYFTISSMDSWKDVNTWAQRVFSLDSKPNLEPVFTEIFDGSESIDEKINKVINFVQDDIRYMGIQSGIGSIKPFHPEQVVKQRFGDCKDKSLLLVWLLKQIGIEKAYPALVHTTMKQDLNKLQPSNQVFNHCIVKFEYADSIYWLDPTMTLQGGNYRTHNTPRYGKSLVIGEAFDSLQDMSNTIKVSLAEIEEHLVIPSKTEPATLTITSIRHGFAADTRRSMLEFFSLEDISKYVEEDLKLVYPEVQSMGKPEVYDSIDKNEITVIYHYQLNDLLKNGEEMHRNPVFSMFQYEPQTVYPYFKSSTCMDREYSYFLDDTEELLHTIIIDFPEDMLIEDSYESFVHEAYFFSQKIQQLGPRRIMLKYKYKNKIDHIRAEDYKDFCKEREKIIEGLPTIFYFPN